MEGTFYEIKCRQTRTDNNGTKKSKFSLLVQAECLVTATMVGATEASDMDEKLSNLDDKTFGCRVETEILSVSKSTIIEDANPDIKTKYQATQGWTVTLKYDYTADNGKDCEKKYCILLWDSKLPSTGEGELKKHLEGIDPTGNEFEVVKISKSPVKKVINGMIYEPTQDADGDDADD